MPTRLHSEILHEKTQVMNLKTSAKKSSVQYQNVVDKQIISSKGHHYKPWPGRKLAKVDEVLKPISTIPSYADMGEKTEDKASNFAAPDWGRLEKLTYLRKQVASRKVGDSNVKESVSGGENVNISDTMGTRVSSTSIEKYKSMDMKLKSYPGILLPGAKKERLLKRAQAEAEGKTVESKKPIVVKYGLNHVTYLIEQNKAQLVVIAHDVDPIELVVWLPALCRKMEIPYCIVKGKARLGAVVHNKTASVLCLTTVKNEDKLEFSKILEAIKANFNDKFEELRKKWGGGIMGSKSQAKTKAKERILAKEAAQRAN